jgi:hypothetical protein
MTGVSIISTLPLDDNSISVNTKKWTKTRELVKGKWLGENVCDHVHGRYVIQRNLILRNSLTNEMKVDVDMFGSSVECGVLWEVDHTLIVAKESRRWWWLFWYIGEISAKSLWIQMTSFAACVKAMYSNSMLDKVTMGCFLELHETDLSPSKNAKPEIEWWSRVDAQSVSEYLQRDGVAPPRINEDFSYPWDTGWRVARIPGE